jgi:hypothetical protein
MLFIYVAAVASAQDFRGVDLSMWTYLGWPADLCIIREADPPKTDPTNWAELYTDCH